LTAWPLVMVYLSLEGTAMAAAPGGKLPVQDNLQIQISCCL
jgi:hypothetical protein